MIPIKNRTEIRQMREGGKRLAEVMRAVVKEVKPGVSLTELDSLAESLIKEKEGKPSFKLVPGYHWATCININQGVVHGIPNQYQVRNGDVVSVDMGMLYRGLHTDMATSMVVRGGMDRLEEKELFLAAGRRALREAIKMARSGNHIGNISKKIQEVVEENNLTPIEALVGHGVGRKLHEEPKIPGIFKDVIEKTPELKPGMVLAIEIIYSQGKSELTLRNDGWTIETKDGSLAGLFENTVAVTREGPFILTA